eukprot:m.254863 g.254863  ORF g.254863 m.254863 type:complete len:853 (+) comp11008_c0_seq2:220-2778(+)
MEPLRIPKFDGNVTVATLDTYYFALGLALETKFGESRQGQSSTNDDAVVYDPSRFEYLLRGFGRGFENIFEFECDRIRARNPRIHNDTVLHQATARIFLDLARLCPSRWNWFREDLTWLLKNRASSTLTSSLHRMGLASRAQREAPLTWQNIAQDAVTWIGQQKGLILLLIDDFFFRAGNQALAAAGAPQKGVPCVGILLVALPNPKGYAVKLTSEDRRLLSCFNPGDLTSELGWLIDLLSPKMSSLSTREINPLAKKEDFNARAAYISHPRHIDLHDARSIKHTFFLQFYGNQTSTKVEDMRKIMDDLKKSPAIEALVAKQGGLVTPCDWWILQPNAELAAHDERHETYARDASQHDQPSGRALRSTHVSRRTAVVEHRNPAGEDNTVETRELRAHQPSQPPSVFFIGAFHISYNGLKILRRHFNNLLVDIHNLAAKTDQDQVPISVHTTTRYLTAMVQAFNRLVKDLDMRTLSRAAIHNPNLQQFLFAFTELLPMHLLFSEYHMNCAESVAALIPLLFRLWIFLFQSRHGKYLPQLLRLIMGLCNLQQSNSPFWQVFDDTPLSLHETYIELVFGQVRRTLSKHAKSQVNFERVLLRCSGAQTLNPLAEAFDPRASTLQKQARPVSDRLLTLAKSIVAQCLRQSMRQESCFPFPLNPLAWRFSAKKPTQQQAPAPECAVCETRIPLQNAKTASDAKAMWHICGHSFHESCTTKLNPDHYFLDCPLCHPRIVTRMKETMKKFPSTTVQAGGRTVGERLSAANPDFQVRLGVKKTRKGTTHQDLHEASQTADQAAEAASLEDEDETNDRSDHEQDAGDDEDDIVQDNVQKLDAIKKETKAVMRSVRDLLRKLE